jgi:hypothetical protein
VTFLTKFNSKSKSFRVEKLVVAGAAQAISDELNRVVADDILLADSKVLLSFLELNSKLSTRA